MKKIVIFTIFTVLMILSLQQTVFSEIDEKEERVKEIEEAIEKYKRKVVNKEVQKIEEENEEKEIRKIPSKLIKLLPTENKLEEITFRTIWKYVDTESNLDEEIGIETTTAILRDITRVYDPIVNKYKVPTIQIEIIKFNDRYEFEYYWDEISSTTIENIFDNAYLIGSPNENTHCMFNYSVEGAVTLCVTNEYMIQSTIYDKYQEHFTYNKLKTGPKKLQINQDEMTIRIVDDILNNIENNKNIKNDHQLFEVLESNKEFKENKINKKQKEKTEEVNNKQVVMKSLGVEKDLKFGIQNFSCIKDEFELVTISGQYNNNQIKKDKIILEILFLDYEQNIIFKNTANLLELDEFETKRFLGNTKINKQFSTCTIKVNN
jgi:hypothetical protein